MYKKVSKILMAMSLIGLVGCARGPKPSYPNDPYENMNRKIFNFNHGVDKVVFKPLAIGYSFIIIPPARKGVTNFFANLGELPSAGNAILQADPRWMLIDIWRFIINSSIGIGGLADPASFLGLPKQSLDFGLTLRKWGYKNSTYIVLPILGPSSVRDMISIPVNGVMSPTNYIEMHEYSYILSGVGVINGRANALPYDHIIDGSPDPYAFVRNAYMQARMGDEHKEVKPEKTQSVDANHNKVKEKIGKATAIKPVAETAAGVALSHKIK